ncbi:MAG: hypothetical protein ACRDTA_00115 [Pseudonocardiaceae bacterium]
MSATIFGQAVDRTGRALPARNVVTDWLGGRAAGLPDITLLVEVGVPCVYMVRCRRDLSVRRHPLTSYSVLLSGSRATVTATWPGEWSDHSAKVTTLTK